MKAIPRLRSTALQAFLVAAAIAAGAPSHASALFFFKFTPIADTQLGFPFQNLDPFPSINGSGRVAFSGTLTGGVQGVFTRLGNGGIATLADTGVSSFSDFGIETSINSLNVVSFGAFTFQPSGVVVTILRGQGNSATPLISDSDNLFAFCGNQINNEGSVVFRAERANGTHEVRAQGAGPLTGVHRLIAEEGSEFSSLGCAPSIAHDGTVAFTATRLGRRAIFTRAKNGQLTQMIDESSGFASFNDVALNQFGGLAFSGSFPGGGHGLFRIKDGFLTTLANTLISNQGAPAGFSINESGTVAFELSRDANGSSVHLGPSNLFGRLVGTGSVISNRTVLFAHLGRGGLNSVGQVVVSLGFFGGNVMIARGDQVRFPDSVVATGGLLLTSSLGGSVDVGTSFPVPPKGALLTFDLTFLSLGGRLDVEVGGKVMQSIVAADAGVRRKISVPLDPRMPQADLRLVFMGKQGASAQIAAVTIAGADPLDAETLAKWKVDESGRGHASVVNVARYPMRAQVTKAATQDPRKPGVTLVYAAVLSDESVDATVDLDRASLRVAGAAPRGKCSQEHVDGDKFIDLLCEVELQEAAIGRTGIVPLEAMTYSGWAIEGSASFAASRFYSQPVGEL